MPKHKDLKRAVRARMQRTGESYTAARLQLVSRKERDYAAIAGMSNVAVRQKTGRDWIEWVRLLDAVNASAKPHREIVHHVASFGAGSWWSQMITVGYERIRGLRAAGQMRSGTWSVTKSKTFAVPVERLFEAFADERLRRRWLPVELKIRTGKSNKTMRVTWDDSSLVAIGFTSKAATKSAVALEHSKLPDKAAAERMKAFWGERLQALAELLA